jgi:hypothetical protein
MKKIIISLCLLINSVSFAQVATLNSVSNITTLASTNASTLIITDSLRGGNFALYTGTNPVDNGIIFKDASNRKWMRQQVDAVNINWFGAKADGTDNRAIILNAIKSSKLNTGRIKIYVPETATDAYYFVSDSIVINDKIELFGEGYQSKIMFAAHKSGFKFAYPGAQYSYMHDILIQSNTTNKTFDPTKHGIILKTYANFNNVWVRFFDGCGFYAANAYDKNNLYILGNSNTSSFYQCHAFANRLHGFYFKGGDANAMIISNCDASNNGGVGYYDQSFLGNHFTGNHAATNGSPEIPYQRGLVKFGGTVYACIKDETSGHVPPNATYWQDIGKEWFTSYPAILNYNPSTVYYAVAGYILEGGNQYGTLLGNYCELDQAPGYIDYRNIDFGSNIPTRNLHPKIYGSLGNVRSSGYFAGDIGIVGPWIYSDDLAGYHSGLSTYPAYRGVMVGGTTKSGMVDFWDNNNRIATHYTTPQALNILTQAGKDFSIYTNNNTTTPKIFAGTNGVGINTAAPSSSAQLDVTSTTKGFLPPRMTAAQASAIITPAEGLLVYVTNTNATFSKKGWWGYNGTVWEKLNN